MSRVYEALKKADKERRQKITKTEVSTAKPAYEEKKKDKKKIDKEKVKSYEGLQREEKLVEEPPVRLLWIYHVAVNMLGFLLNGRSSK